jgi:hypothetical protein
MGLVMAYADPPYIGQSKKHYGDHEDYAGEVDHGELVGDARPRLPGRVGALALVALDAHRARPLPRPRARPDGRRHSARMAWVKPFAAFKKNVRVAYAWEPGSLLTRSVMFA